MSQAPDFTPEVPHASPDESVEGGARDESHARQVDRFKMELQQCDDLAAIVGHELRNPLHALTLQLTVTRASAVASGHAETIARVEKSSRMLARYVDRATVLFELIRSRAEVMTSHPVQTDLSLLIRSVGEGLTPEAQFRSVELDIEVPDCCPAFVDPQFVEQMVDNLVINAFKHAAASRVTLRLIAPADVGSAHARIEVVDDGRGISALERENVFGLLRVGQNSRRGTGTGLGLWIVTRLATALGGAVSLHTRPEGGSTFALDIPLSMSVRNTTDP